MKGKIKALYPYKNLSKDNIHCYYHQTGYFKIRIIYDSVPEKYVTIEQAKHDIEVYYRILKKNL